MLRLRLIVVSSVFLIQVLFLIPTDARPFPKVKKPKHQPEITKLMEEIQKMAAHGHIKEYDISSRRRYGVWRREYDNPNHDHLLKWMKDQILMAKVYASIARSKKTETLHDMLTKHIKMSERDMGQANSDGELGIGAFVGAKAMASVLLVSRGELHDCVTITKKLRAMLLLAQQRVRAWKKQTAFLSQLWTDAVPKSLHCLSLRLTVEFFLLLSSQRVYRPIKMLEDPNLRHFVIFSDNVLAVSVVINSTIWSSREPSEKHVFHIVTDKLNFPAMSMWFSANSPPGVTVQIDSFENFKWFNSELSPVLRQLESAVMEKYSKYKRKSKRERKSVADVILKHSNLKQQTILNHLQFYLPQLFPKLRKILFLHDDVVVQKDLTSLWYIDMKGMVNAAVETCKHGFNRFHKYLKFSNPKISSNFDPDACAWDFGMNMFDLKEWKKQNITGKYLHWQNLNENNTLWDFGGSLPAGLVTFYESTHLLPRTWHVVGLDSDSSALNPREIERAAVIHYTGNQKPWMDNSNIKYKPYWTKFLSSSNRYLQECYISK